MLKHLGVGYLNVKMSRISSERTELMTISQLL